MGEKKDDDRFKKFGTVSFASTTKVNDFITHLEQGRITGTKCPTCGLVFFPPRADCYQCFSSKLDWFTVTGTGRLLTYSKLEFAPLGFEKDVPYAIALLDYGDFKIFGRIAPDIPIDQLQIGMEMKTVVNHLPNGQLNYVFQKV